MSLVDVFVDLTRCAANAKTVSLPQILADPDGLGAISASVTCWLPKGAAGLEAQGYQDLLVGSGPQVLNACNDAIARAAQREHPLLVLLDAVTPGNEAVAELLEVLDRDPLFGFATPRQSTPGGEIHRIDAKFGDEEIPTLCRRVLSQVPDLYIVPELLSSCFLVRREVVANLGPLDESFSTLAGAWLHYLCRARRIGFRCVVVNTAVVGGAGDGTGSTVPVEREDFWRLHRIYPDTTLAREQLRQLPAHAHETLLARAFSGQPDISRTLLIDVRGMGACFNGTSYCTLGLLDGLARANGGWRITLLAQPNAADYHRLRDRYPHWDILHSIDSRRFRTALRLSQPWAVETMAELHRIALFNIYSILDTINWDVIYPGVKNLDEAWCFLSEHADGITYISDFTRNRYRMRFPLAAGVREFTQYLSFHPVDYTSTRAPSRPEERYVMLIGNELDHKCMAQTVELLTQAYPLQPFSALGYKVSNTPLLRALPSGLIPEEEVEELYARARAIVFPSFYEGFGFPILKGLSYGRTVIARHSDLLQEVAARHRSTGRLLAFRTPMELVEMLGRVLHGQSVEQVPLGASLADNEEPMDWVAIGQNLLRFVEETSEVVDSRRWLARDRAVRQFSALRPTPWHG